MTSFVQRSPRGSAGVTNALASFERASMCTRDCARAPHAGGPGSKALIRSAGGWYGTARVLANPWQRLRGLLGTRRAGPRAGLVLLTPCSSIHTCGMAYAIDVAFVSEEGVVVASLTGVGPWRLESVPGARHVLERPSSTGPWPQKGEQLWLFELE